MKPLLIIIPVVLVVGVAALFAFMWSMRNGQYEDMDGAAQRILDDSADDAPKKD
jgi:cbb3-type cytochrome oxidase maturation protein